MIKRDGAGVQWRRFAFFEKSSLGESSEGNPLVGQRACCLSAAGGLLAVGDEDGGVLLGDLELSAPSRCHFQAFGGGVRFLCLREWSRHPLGKGGGVILLFAVATESSDSNSDLTTALKCWSVSPSNGSSSPSLLAVIDTGKFLDTLAAATAFSVSPVHGGSGDDGAGSVLISIGFAEGSVLLYEFDCGTMSLLSEPRVMCPTSEDQRRGVSAFHFSCEDEAKKLSLFICYETQTHLGPESQGILSMELGQGSSYSSTFATKAPGTGNATAEHWRLLDEQGCADGCSSINPDTQELVVGRRDGVYFYSSEDRGGAAGIDGEKNLIVCLSGYILISSVDDRSQRGALCIYDLQNKFIAFHSFLPPGQSVLGATQCVLNDAPTRKLAFVLLSSGSILKLKERSISAKLDLLHRKNLYPAAISLAYSAGVDSGSIMDMYRMYGDHLYRKNDFEGAMTQYLHTIGRVEPSYVITRFLDAQRIHLLTKYLGRLHETGHANSDHTTLLLNCYTKLQDVDNLDAFIERKRAVSGGEESGNRTPDAVKKNLDEPRLRLGHSTSPGTTLANAAVTVEKDDTTKIGKSNFDVDTALRVLKGAGYSDHACLLAEQNGAHDWYVRVQLERSTPDYKGALDYIRKLDASLAEFYLNKHGKALVTHLPQETTGMLMALCTGKYATAGVSNAEQQKSVSPLSTLPGASPLPKPEDFIHLYVDHPKWLRLFLQYMIRQRGGACSPVVANTLLEMLLREWSAHNGNSMSGSGTEGDSSSSPGDSKQLEEEIMSLLLNSDAQYDVDHALVLVQALNFRPGQLCLYEKLHMTSLILEHYMVVGDTRSMLRMCTREGQKSPQLWQQVLRHVVSQAGLGNNDGLIEWKGENKPPWDDVIEVLELLGEHHYMLPPLQVVQILMSRPDLPLGIVRQYLGEWLQDTLDVEESGSKEAYELEAASTQMRRETSALRSASGLGFEFDGFSKATTVGSTRLPGDGAKFREIKLSQVQRSSDHEQFYRNLEDSEDGFAQIAAEFGKGVIPRIV